MAVGGEPWLIDIVIDDGVHRIGEGLSAHLNFVAVAIEGGHAEFIDEGQHGSQVIFAREWLTAPLGIAKVKECLIGLGKWTITSGEFGAPWDIEVIALFRGTMNELFTFWVIEPG